MKTLGYATKTCYHGNRTGRVFSINEEKDGRRNSHYKLLLPPPQHLQAHVKEKQDYR